MITANKGEWSEFYAFLKILSDRKLFAADAQLNKIPDKSFDVLNITREEIPTKKIIYDLTANEKGVTITNTQDKVIFIEESKLKSGVKKLLEEIKAGSKSSFSITSAEELLNMMRCQKIKSASGKKEDIIIEIKDRIASTNVELGFSIKSMLGGASTLLNASGHTNFIFCINNPSGKGHSDINKISGKSKVRDRMSAVEYNFGNISFEKIESGQFKKNLLYIDSQFERMLAEMVLTYYRGKATNIREIVDYLDEKGILENSLQTTKSTFTYKVKEFLVSVALGMTPGKKWTGETVAQGGYIIVKEDGDVVCYHLYNREEFKEYLYNNTKLETPSSTRHKFAEIYDEGNKKCIKLNIQIRFQK